MGPSLALVRIESEPPGATVFIGREDLGARGQTPLTLALPPGPLTAIVELAGHRSARASAAAVVGHAATIWLALDRVLGTLVVEGEPAQFQLRLDSDETPPLLGGNGRAKVLPGEHLVFVSAGGYVPQTLRASVPPDGEAQLRFRLTALPPPSGALVVRSNIDGALVRVDGKEVGFTPSVVESIPVGEHKLEVLADGREPVQLPVTILRNQREAAYVKCWATATSPTTSRWGRASSGTTSTPTSATSSASRSCAAPARCSTAARRSSRW
jgi:hypothetical protein